MTIHHKSPTKVSAQVNYTAPMEETPRYHATDPSRDVHVLDPRTIKIIESRSQAELPRLEREGFQLMDHRSAVTNFLDPAEVERVYYPEIRDLIVNLTGARAVAVVSTPFVRFGERSELSGQLNNSRPARFIHIDYGDTRGRDTAAQVFASLNIADWQYERFVHYNIWRVLTPPPQDIPLAVCDARSLAKSDLISSLAVFDFPGVPERTAESFVVRHNPAHRWHYYRDMTPEEALVFVTNESDPMRPHHIPHTAFDDPTCPADVTPRSSIEIRVCAFFDQA